MPRAQCLCGDVIYEVDGPLQFVHDCHCTRCQKSHGTGSVTMAAVPKEKLRFVQGEDAVARFQSSKDLQRCFCRRCGSAVPGGDEGDGITFFPIGALEGEYEANSDGHIFVSTKAPWNDITDGLPAFDGFPPGVDLPVLEDLGRTAQTPGRVGGSCLCGKVGWEFDGPPQQMRRCHCLRCRRARAHSHAANAFVAPDAFHWTSGEADVVLFKLPDAERFSQAFCETCGSKAPWFIAERGFWNVPLGNLDDDPGAKPSEHIFVGSKAPWHEITDGVVQWEEYPEG